MNVLCIVDRGESFVTSHHHYFGIINQFSRLQYKTKYSVYLIFISYDWWLRLCIIWLQIMKETHSLKRISGPDPRYNDICFSGAGR